MAGPTYPVFVSRVSRQLKDHEERLEVAEERLDRHEADIASLEKAHRALAEIEQRRLAEKRRSKKGGRK